MPTVAVDLGCGGCPRNHFEADELIGVDAKPLADDIKGCKVGYEPLPFEDSSVDYVTAYDFLEHLPRVMYYKDEFISPFISTMNEIWRILKPNGLFHGLTPAYPHPEAFQDPTHVNFITDKTLGYFVGAVKCQAGNDLGELYGFTGKFKGTQAWRRFYLEWNLEAIKE